MLNQNLLDKKDIEIAKLKLMIKDFKEYDEKRKKYYADKMQRLGELESFFEELNGQPSENEDENSRIFRLQKKVLNQRLEINRLQKTISNKDIDLEKYKTMEDILNVEEENRILKKREKELKNENLNLKKTISELVYKLNKIKDKDKD